MRPTASQIEFVGHALAAAVAELDASLGGGHRRRPEFAPRASGDVATGDLVYRPGCMGIATGSDREAPIATDRWLEKRLGHSLRGALLKAGAFPKAPYADAQRAAAVTALRDEREEQLAGRSAEHPSPIRERFRK